MDQVPDAVNRYLLIICVVIFLYPCLTGYVSHVDDRFFNTPRLSFLSK
jgi:hypothetical protein